jgi:C_GCAxxG_C_C family probable redox protein
MDRVEEALACHKQGYNCSQAVAMAFARELELPRAQAARLASALGGGLGQMREVCGALSGAALVLGAVRGWGEAPTPEVKQALYATMRGMGEAFEREHGSARCGRLLGLTSRNDSMPPPEARPCDRLIASAVRLLERTLAEGKLDADDSHP